MANILSTIASWFSRQRSTSTRVYTTGTTEVYPTIDSSKAITRGFNSNTVVYSIIKKDAKKFGSIARYVEAKAQEQKSNNPEVIEGPLQDLLNRPNAEQGQDAFLALVRAFYKVCGEAFIWLNRGDTDSLIDDELVPLEDEAHSRKPVIEMFVLPSNQVIVVPDPDNIFGVYGYILESNTRVPIRKVDIIHWKDINLNFDIVSRDHLRGYPALQAGIKALEQNNSATDAAVRMYQNGGAKGALVNKSMASMNPGQETQLRNVIDTKVNSNDIKNAIAAFQGEWSYLNFGLTSVDMELLKGLDISKQDLCNLLGMPYELFNSETTFANKEMAQKSWVINEIMPDCRQLDGELNRVLLKAFNLEKTAAICSDFEDMAELQEDKAKMVEWLTKAPITVDEYREAIGYEEIGGEEGETVIIPTGLQTLDDLISGDGGEEIMQSLYGATGKPKPTNGAVKKPVKA